MTRKNSWLAAAPLCVWIMLAAMPTPAGLETSAWRYFGLFAAVITGLILEPMPASVIGLLGVTLATILGFVHDDPKTSAEWALGGFSNRTVWLIFGALMISMGYEKSGLGRRLALHFVKHLGRRTLGLGYAIVLADLIIAPGMPSNTARSGGTIYPVIRAIPTLFGSAPGPTGRRIGAYLMWTAFAGTAVTSSMFLTGLAPNPLAVGLIAESAQVNISWGKWFLGFLPMGMLLISLVPLLSYVIYPPEIKSSNEAPQWASQQLDQLGPVSAREMRMAILMISALVLWIVGGSVVNGTTVVLIMISLMILLRIIAWSDVLGNAKAWDVLVWFATLVTLASGLKQVGFIDWVAHSFSALLSGYSVISVMVVLVGFFYFVHYMFASLTAHTVALLPVVLTVGLQTPGIPLAPYALLLCYSLGLMGVLTPYATGPAPIYYGSGYISRTDFWRLGLIFGLIYFGTLLAIGVPYLLLLDANVW